MKYYIVLIQWSLGDDNRVTDCGCDVMKVTTNYREARTEFKRLRDNELSDEITKDWTIVSDCENYFHHHGSYPNESSIRILEFDK